MYRKLALLNHPDKNLFSTEYQVERFINISFAYKKILNQRKNYFNSAQKSKYNDLFQNLIRKNSFSQS
jgi:DnaJ-class molecular chaperone